MRLINHVQVLAYAAPPAIHFLEHWGRALRPAAPWYLTYPPRDDDTLNHHPLIIEPAASRVSSTQLLDLLPVLTPDRPILVAAVERGALIQAEAARRRIITRLHAFGADDLAATDALTEQLAKNRGLDPHRE